jgi:hypothetical protein
MGNRQTISMERASEDKKQQNKDSIDQTTATVTIETTKTSLKVEQTIGKKSNNKKKTKKKKSKSGELPAEAVREMMRWLIENKHEPYPSRQVQLAYADTWDLTEKYSFLLYSFFSFLTSLTDWLID